MGSEGSEKDMEVTQISIGGFDSSVTAKELTDYLENNIGLVWRCRVKTSSTPPASHPNFDVNANEVRRADNYRKVEPHAFVHFVSRESVTSALDAAGCNQLFLKQKPLKVSLGPENPYRINQWRRTTAPITFKDVCIEIGILASLDEFFVGWRGPEKGVDFLVDPFDGTCKIHFTKETAFYFNNTDRHAIIKCNFKVEFLVRDIRTFQEYKNMSSLVIMLQLASSPLIYYRTADDDIEESATFDLLDDDDPWIRTTDFTRSGAIGRCNSYRVIIPPRHGLKFKKTMQYFKEQRIPLLLNDHQRQQLKVKDEPDFGLPMSDPFFFVFKENLAFEILFLVNAAMHKGIINQHQISKRFYSLFRNQPKEVNISALKHICSYKRPVFDAYKRLKKVQEWLLKNPKLLKVPIHTDDIMEVRRLAITPTRAYFLLPEVELANRVIRHYRDVSNRFLRVTFMDEGMQTMNSNVLSYYTALIVKDISSGSSSQKTNIYKRVKMILTDGFYLCGRKYSFLAFSSNQLRDRSAWFFAEDSKHTVLTIRSWMGRFTNKNIAKCAARMGQCFSSTYATVDVPVNEVNSKLNDITRNDYNFSDGIGMITPDLAIEVTRKLKLDIDPPSAYQIRYAGCKGVVACWPGKDDGIRLSLRPSMIKFESKHTILEICSWTRFQPGFLNRQIVTLLSALNVPDGVFWEKQNSQISKLNEMLVNPTVAFDVLTASCAEQGNTAAIMLSAGFQPQIEPHLRGMLSCIRAAQLWGLREKARIFVPSGRWLMGCLDELGILEQGQCFIQVSTPLLENCFSKHGSRFSETKRNLQVIKGYVAIAKNPCLHPGDVRILEAVDDPSKQLHHLVDCLVFPQKGERPHTNEASGSDLDGDLYFVTWDESLIPPSKKSWIPMEYAPVEAQQLGRPVNMQDIIDFFAKNMVNESLGAICNAHVVHADLSDYGALDEKCIKLAELAATAVDFPKTGKIVTMPGSLKPKLYPDFMGKKPFQSYKSNKILGRLYREIKGVYDEETTKGSELAVGPADIPYDEDLEVPGSEYYLDEAWSQKCAYDRQLSGLLGQYKVDTEEEIVTGHVWSMPKYNSKKQGELKERLKHAYSSLKKDFRQMFERLDSKFEQLTNDERSGVYEMKASAQYQVTYNPKWVNESFKMLEEDGGVGDVKLLLSFAWIPADYLARIKIRCRGTQGNDPAKPIGSLAKYIADRVAVS